VASDTTIRIRAYNVGFGDCLLVRIPDGSATRWLLIDFGNAPGQQNDRFQDIAEDIEKETGGHLDVVVMTTNTSTISKASAPPGRCSTA